MKHRALSLHAASLPGRRCVRLSAALVGALMCRTLQGAESAATGAAVQLERATSLSYLTLGLGTLGLAVLLAGLHRFSLTGMRRWNVNTRLAAGFTGLLVVLAGLAVESGVSLKTAVTDFTEYRSDARHSNLANDIQAEAMEMRIAAYELVVFRAPESIEHYAAHQAKLLGALKLGESAIHEPELLKKIKAIEAAVAQHAALHVNLQKAVADNDTAAAADLNRQMNVIGLAIDRDASAIETDFINQQNEAGPRITADLQHTQSVVIWVSLAAMALGAGFAVIIARSISGPLRQLSESLGAGADQTSAAAGQVSAASQALAEGASEQAASLEETSASLEELSSMTKRNADSSLHAKQTATVARTAAAAGSAQMEAMHTAMQAIKSASDDITKILKTIDEIAFQTNILALNAAVEAARAGEHGMGFAIVAEEVRALAQRSAHAAKDTAAKIEQSVIKSQQGAQINAEVAKSFSEIQTRIEQLDHLVAEIATASGEQSRGIVQITTAVSQMDEVTQTNAGSAEETAAAAEELNSQSVMLKDAVHQLQILTGARPAAAASRPTARPPTPVLSGPASSIVTSAPSPAKAAVSEECFADAR